MGEKVNKEQLFVQQAPNFNFEYGPDEILEMALKLKFVIPVEGEDDLFEINDHYEGRPEVGQTWVNVNHGFEVTILDIRESKKYECGEEIEIVGDSEIPLIQDLNSFLETYQKRSK